MTHTQRLTGLVILFMGLSLTAQIGLDQIDVHGYISQGYVYTGDVNFLNMNTRKGTYELNEAAINFSTDITDRLRGGVQFLSRDMGKVGNNVVMLDWAYADYHWKDALGIRIGKIKTPLAMYNEVRDVDALRTFVLLPQSVYDENLRDFSFAFQGAALYGNIFMGSMGDIDYMAYAGTFNIADPNTGFWKNSFLALAELAEPFMTAENAVITKQTLVDPGVTADYIWGGSGYWSLPIEGLRMGGCYLYGKLTMASDIAFHRQVTQSTGSVFNEILQLNFSSDIAIKDYTLSGEYTWNNLTLTGEYQHRTYIAHIPMMGFKVDAEYMLSGYYGQAVYRLLDWLEIGSYYSIYDDTDSQLPDEPEWYYTQNDLCAAVRMDITPNWLIKLEAHQIEGAGLVMSFENPQGRKKNWNLAAIKSSVSF
jgi:hypothetical protein